MSAIIDGPRIADSQEQVYGKEQITTFYKSSEKMLAI